MSRKPDKSNIIRINLADRVGIHGLMTTRGVPRHLLRHDITISDAMLSRSGHGNISLPPSRQLGLFRKSLDRPTYGSWLMIVGTDQDETTALTAVAGIVERAVLKGIKDPHLVSKPLWWPLYGGRYDKLRDDESFRSGQGRLGMIVLTNLAENSTPEKIEKARDLLEMFSGIPRILVVAGIDPLEFAATKLYKRASRAIYFRRRSVTSQI